MTEASGLKACSLLIRGGIVIPDPSDADSIIEDGAVCVRDNRIVAVGPYWQLAREFVPEAVRGSARHLIMPGMVNAHDHVRAPSTRQLGIPDDVLEAWIIDLLRLPQADPCLASTLACCRQLQSGVTTVLNSFYNGSGEHYESVLADTVTGCERSGIRTIVSLSMLDQSVVAELLGDILHHLPGSMGTWVKGFLDTRNPVTASDYFEIVRKWHAAPPSGRTRFMVGPVSVHWCSDRLLLEIWDQASSLDLAVQTHLLESPYQRDRATARYGRSVIQFMSDAGLLSPRLSCAHGVHLSYPDIEVLADAGVSVIHCASSNRRLKNGTAPVGRMLEAGVNVGLGLDSLTNNDDDDMFEEMRQVARASSAGKRRLVRIRTGVALRMATVNGASALGMLDEIGTLEAGKKADIVTMKLFEDPALAGRPAPHGDPGVGIGTDIVTGSDRGFLDRVVYLARKSGVDTVMVDGEIVVDDGRNLHIDEQALLDEIHEALAKEARRTSENDATIASLKPYVHALLQRRSQPASVI